MLIPALPNDAADRARERERNNPQRTTLLLAATAAAEVLGPQHSATRALKLIIIIRFRGNTSDTPAPKTLRADQRQAIAEAAEG